MDMLNLGMVDNIQITKAKIITQIEDYNKIITKIIHNINRIPDKKIYKFNIK